MDIVTSNQLQTLRLKATSGNEVPVRDVRLSTDQMIQLIETIERLAYRLAHAGGDQLPDQLQDSVAIGEQLEQNNG